MINRRSAIVIAAGLSALALASCGKAPQTPAAKDTITFSILSTESAQNMESYWKPILADMEKQREEMMRQHEEEKEWLATLTTIDEDEVLYEDFVTCGRSLAESLRRRGVHFVVALTHMRKPNDERLAKEA